LFFSLISILSRVLERCAANWQPARRQDKQGQAFAACKENTDPLWGGSVHPPGLLQWEVFPGPDRQGRHTHRPWLERAYLM
jgi:hypothetical protein